MTKALISGASQRIGRAIAERLLDEGYELILHAHNSIDLLRAWVGEHPRGAQVKALIRADLSTADGQDELVHKTIEHFDSLDLLVNNASLFGPLSFESMDRQSYRNMMAVNADAPFFLTQGLLPLLKKSADPSVINVIDAMWQRPSKQYAHYAASKAALALITRALAIELAPHIRVNGVSPGLILFQSFHSEKMRERSLERIPMKRIGEPHDIAEAIVFLAKHAPYATGEILAIDGGRSIVS